MCRPDRGNPAHVMDTEDWARGEVRIHSGFTRNLTASGGAHLRLHWVPDRPHLLAESLYIVPQVGRTSGFTGPGGGLR